VRRADPVGVGSGGPEPIAVPCRPRELRRGLGDVRAVDRPGGSPGCSPAPWSWPSPRRRAPA